jgi:hypothetical protein
MDSIGKLVVKMGFLSLLSTMPLAAEMESCVDFTTSFPFYAGDTKLPAGHYRVTQHGVNNDRLQVESLDVGAHSVFFEFLPTHSAQPHPKSDITFQRSEIRTI